MSSSTVLTALETTFHLIFTAAIGLSIFPTFVDQAYEAREDTKLSQGYSAGVRPEGKLKLACLGTLFF
jgi:hypothetical protein